MRDGVATASRCGVAAVEMRRRRVQVTSWMRFGREAAAGARYEYSQQRKRAANEG